MRLQSMERWDGTKGLQLTFFDKLVTLLQSVNC